MRKGPERRYASVEQLAGRLGALLERAAGWMARQGNFVNRPGSTCA